MGKRRRHEDPKERAPHRSPCSPPPLSSGEHQKIRKGGGSRDNDPPTTSCIQKKETPPGQDSASLAGVWSNWIRPDSWKTACLQLIEEEDKEASSSPAALPDRPIPPPRLTTLFSRLWHPLTAEHFGRHIFRGPAALYVKRAAATQASGHLGAWLRQELFDFDPRQIYQHTSSESIFVWLLPSSSSSSSSSSSTPTGKEKEKKMIRSIEVTDPEAAYALYQAGHATYCRAPPRLEQTLVAAFLQATGLGCGQYDPTGQRSTCLGRGEVEVFLSPPSSGHLTDWHYDFQENFTLQLSGIKQWTLRRGKSSAPLRGCTPHYQAPEAVESQLKAARLADPHLVFGPPALHGSQEEDYTVTVTLYPGDLLYHPAGIWHKVETIQGPGVSINISLMATNYAALATASLHHLLLQHEAWRQPIVHRPHHQPQPEDNAASSSGLDAVETLENLLQALPPLIEKWRAQGAASAMLPPVLRLRLGSVPLPSPDGDDNDDDQQEELARGESQEEDGDEEDFDIDDGEDEEAYTADHLDDGGLLGEGQDEADEEGGDEEETEEDRVIDADHFENKVKDLPELSHVFDPEQGTLLMKNPLALLLRQAEITQYYQEAGVLPENEMDQDGGKVFVLNVNYGGHENHESHIRLRFKTRYGDEWERHISNPSQAPHHIRPLLQCLYYYGYLVAQPQKA